MQGGISVVDSELASDEARQMWELFVLTSTLGPLPARALRPFLPWPPAATESLTFELGKTMLFAV